MVGALATSPNTLTTVIKSRHGSCNKALRLELLQLRVVPYVISRALVRAEEDFSSSLKRVEMKTVLL